MTTGSYQFQIINTTQASTVFLDTYIGFSLPISVNRGWQSAPFAVNDEIQCLYSTSADFAPHGAGMDVIVELIIGLGQPLYNISVPGLP
jgi:hypothetical protein